MDSNSLQGDCKFQNELGLTNKMLAMGSSLNYGWVVAPLSYCSFDEKHHRRWWEVEEEEVVEEALAASMGTCQRLLLVYKFMHNKSLRDGLVDQQCSELMDRGRRFSVVLNIATW